MRSVRAYDGHCAWRECNPRRNRTYLPHAAVPAGMKDVSRKKIHIP